MELLIEIGVEELPAIPFLKERANIALKWRAVLEANRIIAIFALNLARVDLCYFTRIFHNAAMMCRS